MGASPVKHNLEASSDKVNFRSLSMAASLMSRPLRFRVKLSACDSVCVVRVSLMALNPLQTG
jgi:hypothetical protein